MKVGNEARKMNEIGIEKTKIVELIGEKKEAFFETMHQEIVNHYPVTVLIDPNGKKWNIEIRYRISSKTLAGFYFRQNECGFMLIFGQKERDKVEEKRLDLNEKRLNEYDAAKIFFDGKWVMFMIEDDSDISQLWPFLEIKRKPKTKVR
jgi:hypothetical protein